MTREFVQVDWASGLAPHTFFPAVDRQQPDGSILRQIRVGDRCLTLEEAEEEVRRVAATHPGVYVVESRCYR